MSCPCAYGPAARRECATGQAPRAALVALAYLRGRLTRGAQIGLPARLLSPTTSSSLLAAGLLSAAIFQGTALRLLHSHGPAPAPPKIYGPRRDGKHLYGSGGLP